MDRSSSLLLDQPSTIDAVRGSCAQCHHSAMGSQLNQPASLLCRRWPPVNTGIPRPDGFSIVALYPTVDANQTCGEFAQ